MHVVRRLAGRVVGFRVVPPVSDENSGRASTELRSAVIAIEGRVIVVSDLRAARAFSPETTERFVQLMKADNPKIEKSAMLVPSSASLGLQLQRMVGEAGSAARRVFADRHALTDWMEPSLDAAERDALAAFLDEPLDTVA